MPIVQLTATVWLANLSIAMRSDEVKYKGPLQFFRTIMSQFICAGICASLSRACPRQGCTAVAVISRKRVVFIDPRGLNSSSGNLLRKI